MGHAVEHGIQDRETNSIINAYNISSTRFTVHLDKVGAAAASRPSPSMQMTPREKEDDSPGIFQYLIVGLVPPQKYWSSKLQNAAQAKQQPIGVARPEEVIKMIRVLPLVVRSAARMLVLLSTQLSAV